MSGPLQGRRVRLRGFLCVLLRVLFYVTLRSVAAPEGADELGETVILSSRNGGRLVCRARFKIGKELRLYWPEKYRETALRVVFRQLCGTGELTDLGFEFLSDQNFWGQELQP